MERWHDKCDDDSAIVGCRWCDDDNAIVWWYDGDDAISVCKQRIRLKVDRVMVQWHENDVAITPYWWRDRASLHRHRTIDVIRLSYQRHRTASLHYIWRHRIDHPCINAITLSSSHHRCAPSNNRPRWCHIVNYVALSGFHSSRSFLTLYKGRCKLENLDLGSAPGKDTSPLTMQGCKLIYMLGF